MQAAPPDREEELIHQDEETPERLCMLMPGIRTEKQHKR